MCQLFLFLFLAIRHLNYYIRRQKKQKQIMKEIKDENLLIAYKWLAELHGVLCTDSLNDSEKLTHQIKIENALTRAQKIKNEDNNIMYDEHLEFLFYKNICKVNI